MDKFRGVALEASATEVERLATYPFVVPIFRGLSLEAQATPPERVYYVDTKFRGLSVETPISDPTAIVSLVDKYEFNEIYSEGVYVGPDAVTVGTVGGTVENIDNPANYKTIVRAAAPSSGTIINLLDGVTDREVEFSHSIADVTIEVLPFKGVKVEFIKETVGEVRFRLTARGVDEANVLIKQGATTLHDDTFLISTTAVKTYAGPFNTSTEVTVTVNDGSDFQYIKFKLLV